MATEYVPYTTQQGDRWDLIAWRFYGDAYAFEAIIIANPTVPIVATLPAGILLAIPLRTQQPVQQAQLLPPWKR